MASRIAEFRKAKRLKSVVGCIHAGLLLFCAMATAKKSTEVEAMGKSRELRDTLTKTIRRPASSLPAESILRRITHDGRTRRRCWLTGCVVPKDPLEFDDVGDLIAAAQP